MPFVDDFLEDPPLQPIQSDLQESVGASYSRESSVSLGLAVGAGPTVVNLHEEEEGILNEQFNNMPLILPEADMGIDAPLFNDDEPAPSSSKKRGRPSRSSSGTPAKSTPAGKTPRSTKSVGKPTATPKSAKSTSTPKSAGRSTGRKRKAEEIEPEQNAEESEEQPEPEAEATPAAKRGRPGRPARTAGKAASARLSLKAAKKPDRGRPKGSTNSTERKEKAAAKPKNKGASANDTAEEEYEVEGIRDSGIDDKTKAHKFLVKWKGYPESENTWEPKSNLKGAEELVREFEKNQKKTKAADAAAKVSAPKKEKEEKAPAKERGKAKAVKKVAPAKKPAGRPGRRGRSAKA